MSQEPPSFGSLQEGMDDLRKQKRGDLAASGEPPTPHAEPDANAGSAPVEVNYLSIHPNSVSDAIDLEHSGKEAISKRKPEERTYFWWFTLPYACIWILAVYTKNDLIEHIATLLFVAILLVWFVAKKYVKGLRDGQSMVLWSVVIACISIFIIAPRTNSSSAASTGSPSTQSSTPESQYVLDASSKSACESYLKGKTFRGGSARLEFGFDGTVSAYNPNGSLVFAGRLEIGSAKGDLSRWIYVYDMAGSGKLQFLLSADGKMMESSSFVIYSPT